MSGYGARFWADRTAKSRRRSYPAFRGSHTADAVVIGGGLTGCATAYVLANAGFDVVLLEAETIANGSTAGSPGVIVPQPDAEMRAVEPVTGRRVARTAWKEANRGAADLAVALRKLKIACDLAPAPVVINARHAEDAERLRREQSARKSAGVQAPWLSADGVRAAMRTDSAGALKLQPGFVFDPVRAAVGLAAAAADRGARIFEKSAARRTRFTRKTADVLLATGSIRTRLIVAATGEPGALFSQLRRHVREQEGFAVVTDVLPAAMRREVGSIAGSLTEPGGGVWMRAIADRRDLRLLFAGAASRPPAARMRDKVVKRRTAELMYELSTRYPAISGLPAAWGWSLPIVSTPDGLPWIGPHRNYPFHFFALAFGWHGDGLAWSAARAALRHLRGESRREDESLSFARHL